MNIRTSIPIDTTMCPDTKIDLRYTRKSVARGNREEERKRERERGGEREREKKF